MASTKPGNCGRSENMGQNRPEYDLKSGNTPGHLGSGGGAAGDGFRSLAVDGNREYTS